MPPRIDGGIQTASERTVWAVFEFKLKAGYRPMQWEQKRRHICSLKLSAKKRLHSAGKSDRQRDQPAGYPSPTPDIFFSLCELLPQLVHISTRVSSQAAAVQRDHFALSIHKHEHGDARDAKLGAQSLVDGALFKGKGEERHLVVVLLVLRRVLVRRDKDELKLRVLLDHVLVQGAQKGRELTTGRAPVRAEVDAHDLFVGERRVRVLQTIFRLELGTEEL
uniref:Uncharacterized protein n=1 Tax=Hyaloperonospora arabidopsidis (strain Emoy2) TaxID=559515 RepID=M4B412_HYAAE